MRCVCGYTDASQMSRHRKKCPVLKISLLEDENKRVVQELENQRTRCTLLLQENERLTAEVEGWEALTRSVDRPVSPADAGA